MAPNIALKVAMLSAGKRAYEIADKAQISESRFSLIVNGRTEATEAERKAIAKALRRQPSELFAEVSA